MLPELDLPLSYDEVVLCIKSLKNNKSVGPDGIPSEIFSNMVASRCTYYCMFPHARYGDRAMFLTNGKIYITIYKDLLITIYKNNGDKSMCGNSRGIALLSAAGKILTKLILKRLVGKVSEDL